MKPPILPILIVGLATSAAIGEEPPAFSIRLTNPDQQLREVIKLFDGSRAPHPAAALTAWKRASKEPGRLGKPVEAMIAAFNPTMAGELRLLDDAEVIARFDEKTGDLVWGARLPRDDGTFAAIAPALALSGGAAEDRLGELEVDRLGPPGAPLMARGSRGTFLGGSREGLAMAIGGQGTPHDPGAREGLDLLVEPGAFDRSKSLTGRRLAEFFRVRRSTAPLVSMAATLDGSAAVATGLVSVSPGEAKGATIEPGWVDWVPSDRAMVGFALATDPTAKSWAEAFDLFDRVERVDPARAGVAPLRLRLDVLARSVGLRTEIEIYPHLKGVSGWAGSDGRTVDAAFLAMHFDDEAVADRLATTIRPLPGPGKGANPGPGLPRSLGLIEGRSLEISKDGKSVLLSWGDGVLEASRLARRDATRSAGPVLRQFWGDPPTVACGGGVWPGRVPGLLPEGSPLKTAVAASPPIRWQASRTPIGLSITLSATNLDATVWRFLDLIPLDPPPDH